jgi:kynurenine formamidase
MAERPSEEQVLAWLGTLSNWGRWGAEDERGTINLITAEKRRAAAALAQEGVSVSCARPIEYEVTPDVTEPVRHFMLGTGESAPERGLGSSSDAFLIAPHGRTLTHVDALAHWMWDGKLYNGRPAKMVNTRDGAQASAVALLAEGVVTRGVLLDIAGLRGVDWLEGGEPIFPEELEAAEHRQGVRVEAGDALLVRTGYPQRRAARGPDGGQQQPGLQAACLPWLHERDVAVLASDTINDHSPSGYPRVISPVHTVGIVALGLWLIDNCDHAALAAACAHAGRWEFLFLVAPLPLKNATGCPVNPIAVF